jgi:hypothetical protein
MFFVKSIKKIQWDKPRKLISLWMRVLGTTWQSRQGVNWVRGVWEDGLYLSQITLVSVIAVKNNSLQLVVSVDLISTFLSTAPNLIKKLICYLARKSKLVTWLEEMQGSELRSNLLEDSRWTRIKSFQSLRIKKGRWLRWRHPGLAVWWLGWIYV